MGNLARVALLSLGAIRRFRENDLREQVGELVDVPTGDGADYQPEPVPADLGDRALARHYALDALKNLRSTESYLDDCPYTPRRRGRHGPAMGGRVSGGSMGICRGGGTGEKKSSNWQITPSMIWRLPSEASPSAFDHARREVSL